jgi:peptidoglycan/LPS O-acetylase OafA/YrhL
MAADATPSPRLHQLDGLRAVACLLVVAAHSVTVPIATLLARRGFPAAAVLVDQLAASGVDLFFTLSGVVLLRPFLRGERAFHLGRYLWRRATRIYPPYLACLAATAPLLMAAGHLPNWFSREILPPFRWSDLVAQVPILWPTPVTWNFAWWSLRIEVVFYLVAPLVVLAWRGTPFHAWAAIAAGAACVALGWLPWPPTTPSADTPLGGLPAAILAMSCRYATCFFMGIVAAKTDIPQSVCRTLVALGVLLVLLAAGLRPAAIHAGFGLLYGGVVGLAVAGGGLARLLSRPLAVWLGERSYSLFLVHVTAFHLTDWLVAFATPHRGLAYAVLTRAIGLPLALVLAMLLFHTVERRFARGLVTAERFWPPTAGR